MKIMENCGHIPEVKATDQVIRLVSMFLGDTALSPM
jgi:hypothetical protein